MNIVQDPTAAIIEITESEVADLFVGSDKAVLDTEAVALESGSSDWT